MGVVAAGTIYLRYTRTDPRIGPTWKADVILWLCFLVMLGLASYTVYRIFV